MISADLFDRSGERVATAVLHKGKISIRTEDRALEARLLAFFNAPETLWHNGDPQTELAGTEAHFHGRLRALHRQGLATKSPSSES
jgi:hypothetical protein